MLLALPLIVPLMATEAVAEDRTGEIVVFVFEGGVPLADTEVTVGALSGRTGRFGDLRLRIAPGLHPVSVRGEQRATVRVAAGEESEVLLDLRGGRVAVEAPEDRGTSPVVSEDAITGRVRGQIRDVETGKPVAKARIFVRGQAVEAMTDAEGRFELSLPVGASGLSVLAGGYASGSAEVAVVEGDVVEVAIGLTPSGAHLGSFFVRLPVVEGSTAALLDERRTSSSVADVIGAEQMSRSGDSSAASALRRVTGLTVVGGRFVYVRGLGERYSSTTLNGATLPSPDPERRVVPLDMFPASLLDSVVIQKSFSPDMPAEFGGGTVQLRTRRVPDDWVLSFGISGSYVATTTFGRGLSGQDGGATDFLGMDSGHRALPELVADASDASPLEETDMFSDLGYTTEQLEKFGEAMPNRWDLGTRWVPPDLGLSFTVGNGHEVGGAKIGWLVGTTYSSGWDIDRFERRYFAVGEGGALETSHVYAFDGLDHDVGLGLIGNVGVEVGDQAVQLTSLVIRKTSDTARIYQGPNRDVGSDIRVSRLRWVERSLIYNQLSGRFELPGALTPDIDWRYALSLAGRLEPDRAETRFDQDEANPDQWFLSDRPEGNQRFFSALSDRNHDVGLDLTWRFNPEDEASGRVRVGVAGMQKRRGVDTRRFKYIHKGQLSRDEGTLQQDAGAIFVDENIGADGFQFEEITRQTDNYSASQKLLAGYAMVETPLTSWLRVMAGARVEHSDQRVSTFELFNPSQEPVEARVTKTDLLPAATATVALPADQQVRLGYGRTLSRPDFREMSPATFNDVTGGRQTFGNPELQRATIDNVDLRWELFPGAGEVLSIGGFYKRFRNPIETVVIVSAQLSVSYQNALGAENYGVELEWRKNLGFFGSALEDLTLAGNVSLIRSRVRFDPEAEQINTSLVRPLEGQSPYVVNLQAAYDNPETGTAVSLLYNVFGQRIVEVGALGAPDSFELPVHQLDLVASQRIGRGLQVAVKGKNLLDSWRVRRVGAEVAERQREGWEVGLSLKWSPEVRRSETAKRSQRATERPVASRP